MLLVGAGAAGVVVALKRAACRARAAPPAAVRAGGCRAALLSAAARAAGGWACWGRAKRGAARRAARRAFVSSMVATTPRPVALYALTCGQGRRQGCKVAC